MKLVILSGRSGSGKTTALQALEDLGHYCVDNLPLGLLPTLTEQLKREEHYVDRIAVGIDARNLPHQLKDFTTILEQVRDVGMECEVVFLDADDNTLLKRFSATRRKHPLSNDNLSLVEAIDREAELLSTIRASADLVVDTSLLDVHTLRDMVRDRVAKRREKLSVLVESFAYKRGVPHDADLVFDVRVLPNPYWHPELREMTGLDMPVQQYLDQQSESARMLDDISRFLREWLPLYEKNDRSYMTVAIGCTGGQHRSVYMVEALVHHLAKIGIEVQRRHLELQR
ncbi:MAG: RNase adapter RapZ [Gammaproteobacteria bacterium HGW-Gammaproteobacteria-14]|nr:MAG: RNase adapter RapZ [Gammaproteobacteria bacterium HGW-Gammaproteobacteria-14]